MNYHKILKYDTANGPGIRTTIWFTGCCFRCPECFNTEIQDFNAGKLFDEEAKNELFSYLSDSHVTGLSILGGEPLIQSPQLLDLLQEVKERFPDKSIWMWTGFQLKDIIKNSNYSSNTYPIYNDAIKQLQIISYVDYLVDGPFKKDLTAYHTRFRGSSNQIIWRITKDKYKLIFENLSNYYDEHQENNINEISEILSIKRESFE